MLTIPGVLKDFDVDGEIALEGDSLMTTGRSVFLAVVAVSCATLVAASSRRMTDRESPLQRVQAAENDIAGVVTGANGPEAGVWVIAETTDLPTKFVKIVVTDDRGRYLIPDLPKAKYGVWVRGYGLVDSPKRRAARARR